MLPRIPSPSYRNLLSFIMASLVSFSAVEAQGTNSLNGIIPWRSVGVYYQGPGSEDLAARTIEAANLWKYACEGVTPFPVVRFEGLADVYVGIQLGGVESGACGEYLAPGHYRNPTSWPLINLAHGCHVAGQWTPLVLPGGGTNEYVPFLLAHEFGHLFGLDDVGSQNCASSLMYAFATGTGTQISLEDCQAISNQMIEAPPEPEDPHQCARDSSPDDCKASPILLDLSGRGIRLGGQNAAVLFDITGDGWPEWVNWIEPGGHAALLARDLDGNGLVDGAAELFGTATALPDGSFAENGFVALAVLDEVAFGGNDDGIVDVRDAGWGSLLLWLDENADGVCEASEMTMIEDAGVVAIDLDYRTIGRRDRHGNLFRYMSPSLTSSGEVERSAIRRSTCSWCIRV